MIDIRFKSSSINADSSLVALLRDVTFYDRPELASNTDLLYLPQTHSFIVTLN
jgi:hypothetical protein